MLDIKKIMVSFNDRQVVHGISLQLSKGEVGCLLGPSGGGKTTLLRAVAGFEPLQGGTIRIGNRVASDDGVFLAPEDRRVGMVFQDLALFPHLTVAENIGFGLWRETRKARQKRVEELLALVDLGLYRDRFSHQLSGGQQQRVALARAMAPRPDLLLLDEPFSSLDQTLRERLAREVREILRREELTALLVTHDQREAFAMADRIGVIDEGCLLQWGTINELYNQPSAPFVAGFIGEGVLLPGTVVSDGIDTVLGRLPATLGDGMAIGGRACLLVRPEHVILDPNSPHRASVERCAFRGSRSLCSLRLNEGQLLLALLANTPRPGDFVTIGLRIDQPVVFEQAEPLMDS